MDININNLINRFQEYVRIDTQSDENSSTYPSTKKQLNLSKLLFEQLKTLGMEEVELTEHGYVFATLPSNLPDEKVESIPTIGFIAHVDTSPDVSGSDVTPIIHRNYNGDEIHLPKDPNQILKPETDPALKNCIGHDIITSDGTTLLGSDNKAGIAEIMTAMEVLLKNPTLQHGKIRIAFTVDEEIGQGTKYFDVKKFGATYAYTIDGETAGEIEDETFCADTVIVKIKGINMHPGYAKDKLVNSIKIASELISKLPKNELSPETTEQREGYIHPNSVSGGVEETIIKFMIRDFELEGLKQKLKIIENLVEIVLKNYSGAESDITVNESYRNMRYILDDYPQVVEYAMEAVGRSKLTAKKNLIRGGTDGARLSYKGLPTPNIFTGGHNFHSKKEWVSVQNMEKAVETIVNLAIVWTEKVNE
jgi:tripeptide aminopeptidase